MRAPAAGGGRPARRGGGAERPAARADERGQRQSLTQQERSGADLSRDAASGLRARSPRRWRPATPRPPSARSSTEQLADLELRVDDATPSARTRWSTSSSRRWRCRSARSRQLFAKTDLDVDGLLATVREHPFRRRAGRSAQPRSRTRSFDDAELGARFDQLMIGLDRMNLMRIAVEQGPLRLAGQSAPTASPAASARAGGRDACGHRSRRAAGHPIFATADGVVVDAGRESGYGNVVRIRHEFGFETVYAHQSRIRVKVGTTGIAWRANR